MPISRVFHAIKLVAMPVLFAGAVLGLLSVQLTLQHRAERAKSRTVQASLSAQDSNVLSGHLIGLKLQEIAAKAAQGDLAGQIEMGCRFAEGRGVAKNEAQAVRYFQAAIAQAGEVGARDKRAPLISSAFRALSHLHQQGVPSANIPANPHYAFDLLHHAASYFGDPEAQFELAKLLLSGEGVTKNSRAAAQWLYHAARKGHAPSQALLGEMLWRGDGVARAPADGLGLLAIARRNASPEDRPWVSKMFETARAEALPVEILEANAFIVQQSSASSLGTGDETLIDADGQEPVTGLGGRKGAEAKSSDTSLPAVQRDTLQGLSGPPFPPAVFGFNFLDKELAEEVPDPKQLAGMIRMYRPWEIDPDSRPLRLAGVSK